MNPSRQESIRSRLSSALEPTHLDVENESRMHSVRPGSETHFKVVAVSAAFEGLSAVQRHRRVHELLREEFASGLHALTLRLLTPAEWEKQSDAPFRSPPCLGGSKGG